MHRLKHCNLIPQDLDHEDRTYSASLTAVGGTNCSSSNFGRRFQQDDDLLPFYQSINLILIFSSNNYQSLNFQFFFTLLCTGSSSYETCFSTAPPTAEKAARGVGGMIFSMKISL